MKRGLTLAIVIAAGLALGAASAFTLLPGSQNLAKRIGAVTTGKALVGGPFTLVRQDGQTVTQKTYSGKHLLVYFGFTYCPDVCPAGLQVISAALQKLGDKADRVKVVFISVDPQRDTPDKMKEYVASFDPRIDGLTGTPEQVAEAARAYRVYYQRVENKNFPNDYTVDHSSFMYLMNPEGEFVQHFPHSVSPDTLAERIAAVL